MLGVPAAVSHVASNSNAHGASTTSIFIQNSTQVLNSALYHIMVQFLPWIGSEGVHFNPHCSQIGYRPSNHVDGDLDSQIRPGLLECLPFEGPVGLPWQSPIRP